MILEKLNICKQKMKLAGFQYRMQNPEIQRGEMGERREGRGAKVGGGTTRRRKLGGWRKRMKMKQSWISSCSALHFTFLRQGLCTDPDLGVWTQWLASGASPACLWCSSPGVRGVNHHTQLFPWVMGIWTHVLMHPPWALKYQTTLLISVKVAIFALRFHIADLWIEDNINLLVAAISPLLNFNPRLNCNAN